MNENSQQTSIQYIFVRPKNKHYCSYYINTNIKDQHSMKYEELYRFICKMIKPPCTSTVFDLMYSFKPFFIDIRKNEAKVLVFEPEKKLREKIVYKHIEKKAREERKEKKEFLEVLDEKMKIVAERLFKKDSSKEEKKI